MAEDRASNRQVPMDLLATLTASGLAESARRVSEPPSKAGRLEGWLARWLGGSDVGANVLVQKDLDDEWAGGCHARSRRLLQLALAAHR